jgi:hypothetical protein
MPIPGEKTLRTDAWHTGQPLELNFPDHWDVEVLWPATLPALTDEQIADRLDRPTGTATYSRNVPRNIPASCDSRRSEPADSCRRVLPLLWNGFAKPAYQPAKSILVRPARMAQPRSIEKKVGLEAHRDAGSSSTMPSGTAHIGRTLSGTPVLVNKAVLDSDFVIGVGGVYPDTQPDLGAGLSWPLAFWDSVRSRIYISDSGKRLGREKNPVANGA